MHKFNIEIIGFLMGVLLLFNGGFMLLSSLLSLLTNDGVTQEISMAALLTLLVGFLMVLISRKHTKQLHKREGYLVVTFGWLMMSLSGTLPYLFTGVFSDFTSAFFETMSGYTTTLDWGNGNHCFGHCYSTTIRHWWDAIVYRRGPWT